MINHGNIVWPPQNGFLEPPEETVLQPGARIDRYGFENGTFVSPSGTSFGSRSLAPGTENKPYNEYVVVEPILVQSGKAAPWFGKEGGGIQYNLNESVSSLLRKGILKRGIFEL